MWPARGRQDQNAPGNEVPLTFLGRGAQLKGIISFDGEIRIDARLEGEIHTKGTVVIGEHAVIEGDIHADVVISRGTVTGNVTASEKVQLLAPGVLIGTIKTPLLSVEEGVRLSGNCEARGRGEIRTLEGAREAVSHGGAPRARWMT